MGMYTCLFGKVKFKDDVAELVRVKNNFSHGWTGNYHPELWVPWKDVLNTRRIKRHPDLNVFLKDYRVGSVAHGASTYFKVNEYPGYTHLLGCLNRETEGERQYCPKTKELTFFCSLKNYTDTIEKFLRTLPLIADDWELYSQYEELEGNELPSRHVP